LRVVVMLAWPNRAWISFGCAPWAISSAAQECLRS
jgi:hypothetical protein